MEKQLYYILPRWQNEPLCLALTADIKKTMREFPRCDYKPAPGYLVTGNDSGLDIQNFD